MTSSRDLVARALASADEQEQAAFLNAFAHELRVTCRQGHGWEMQGHWIAEHLLPTTQEVLKHLVQTSEFLQEEAQQDRAHLDDVRDQIREAENRLREMEKDNP